jgi:hypothetical protein
LRHYAASQKVAGRLEGLGELKNPMTSLGIETATFQLVA